jgi:hypothetical protein
MEINDETQKISLQGIYFGLFIMSCNKSFRFNCTVIPLLFRKIPATTEAFVVSCYEHICRPSLSVRVLCRQPPRLSRCCLAMVFKFCGRQDLASSVKTDNR